MSKLIDLGYEILKTLLIPKEELKTTQGLSEKNLRAFLEQKGIADFLLYRYYEEDADSDNGMGIYHMAGGRKGIVLRVFPTSLSSKKIEDSVFTLVDNLRDKGTVIQFSTFASRNIKHLLENYKRLHHCRVNVDNTNLLKELVDDTYDFFENGVKETMVKGLDFRIKDFVSTISVLFPEDTSDRHIKQVYNQMLGNLRDLSPVNFDGNSMVRLVKEMLNPDASMEAWDNYYDRHKVMNVQMANMGTTVKTGAGDHFEVGDKWKYRSFTTKQFPNASTILTGYDLYNIFFDRFGDNIQIPLPCPFFASLTVVVGDVEKEKEQALAKARHDVKAVGKLNREIRQQHSELDPRAKEARSTIQLIEQENQTPFKAMFSVTLMDKNLDDLDKYSTTLKNRFAAKNWSIEEEKIGNINLFVFLYGLPLQHHPFVENYLKRFDVLFTSNNAAIAPLLGNIATSEMLVPFFDRNGQIIPYDNFNGDNYNESKTGATGAGKSFSQTYTHIMKLSAGMKIRVIDNGDSYKRFCNMVGGTYINVGTNHNISLNFYTKANTKKILLGEEETNEEYLIDIGNGNRVPTLHPEEINSIVPIIGLMVGVDLITTGKEQSAADATDETYLAGKIKEAVIETYLVHQKDSRLEHTRDIITKYAQKEKSDGRNEQAGMLHKTAVALFDFADKQGAHYDKFNTPNNLDLKKDYVVLETNGLEGIILDVVVVSMAFLVKSEFWKEGNKRKKALDIDEGWKFKDKPLVIKILEDNARTLRKSLSGQGFITQGVEDFSVNNSMQTLFSSSFHKFLLAQDKKEIKKVGGGKFFPLEPHEMRIFESVANKRPYWGEACYMSKKIGTNVFILKASPKTYWAAAGADPSGNQRFDDAKEKYKLTLMETIRYMAYKDEFPNANENDLVFKAKNYAEQSRYNDGARRKYWKEELSLAISEKRVEVRGEPVSMCEPNEISGYEIFSQIRHRDKTVSSYGVIAGWLEEFDILKEYNLHVYQKAFAFFEDNEEEVHINIITEELQDDDYVNELLRLVVSYRLEKRLVVELKDTVNNENINDLQEFISRLKSYGIRTAIDNVGIYYHKMSYLVLLDVDYINIDKTLINVNKDEPVSLVLEMISAFVKNSSTKKLCALKIETTEEYYRVKDLGFDHYQGWILKGQHIVF